VYDRDWKDYHTALFFRSQMNRLSDAGVTVYLIAGNHDAASVISRKLSLPENVKVFPSAAPRTIEAEDLPLAVHGMSFSNRAVDENLVPRYPAPVAGKFNLGLLHTSLAGAEGHDTYAPCSLADLVGKGYDYWALGHIHQPAELHRDPWVVYPGNIQGRHVNECGARGCRVVEVNDDLEVVECKWHPLDVVRWARVSVDLSGVADFDDAVRHAREKLGEAVEEAEGRTLAMRIELTGATELHGTLCSRPDRMEAELHACADEFGEGAVWIERVRIGTRAVVSLAELSERDPLTKVVVEALGESVDMALPAEVVEMLSVLPPELKAELEQGWSGETRRQLVEDACATVLDRLTTKGAEA
jgi:DNA repair exonuclease SbcCD nuclease subunit